MSDGDVILKEIELGDEEKRKPPRRIVHFASGETMEEFSTEEEEDEEEEEPTFSIRNVDTAEMSWRTYIQFWILRMATTAFITCDFLGGKLANLFGLNAPKYQYAIDEYNRAQEADSDDEDEGEEEVNKPELSRVTDEKFCLQMQNLEYGTIHVQESTPVPGDAYHMDSETPPSDTGQSQKSG